MIIKFIKRKLLIRAKIKYIYSQWLKGKDFDNSCLFEYIKLRKKYNFKNELNEADFNLVLKKVQRKINCINWDGE